jgi:hypothetical protein
MISITKIIFGTWVITGLIAIVWGTKAIYSSPNSDKVKSHFKEMLEELKITEEDYMCVLYVSFFVAGFLSLTLNSYRKLRNYIRRRK